MKRPSYPEKAFITAAGRGKRLRPYTDNCPKPLVHAGGKALIDYALDKLVEAGVKDVTVNLHYLGSLIEAHLADRTSPRVKFSKEDKLLDTGGGIKKALGNMKGEAFYAISGDSLWSDGTVPALKRLSEAWNPEEMDVLLLLQPLSRMRVTEGAGDYNMGPDGRLERSRRQSGDYMWTSIRICCPSLFEGTPDGPFSFLEILDKAQSRGRLYGLVHDGEWHHISTAGDLKRVNDYLGAQKRYA